MKSPYFSFQEHNHFSSLFCSSSISKVVHWRKQVLWLTDLFDKRQTIWKLPQKTKKESGFPARIATGYLSQMQLGVRVWRNFPGTVWDHFNAFWSIPRAQYHCFPCEGENWWNGKIYLRGFSLCILNAKIERNSRRYENCKSEILPYPKEHGQGVKILKMMTKNLAKSDKKWGEGVKIGVGGNEAFELVRSGEPQKSLRELKGGTELRNIVSV